MNFRKVMINLILFLILGLIALAVFIFVVNFNIIRYGNNICKNNEPQKQAALVLGARVWKNGRMSDVFRDRVDTAIDLYKKKKVLKILISGDHGSDDYDEVNVAKDYLIEKKINAEDIFLDHAGFDTYDSVYRAKEIFQVKSLVIVTQDFHLSRSLYLADKLKIDVCGAKADLHKYRAQIQMESREVLARIKAWLDILFHSKPKFLGDKINILGNGSMSWD